MVTHGFVAFKYKGIYYNYYNHSSSYCDGLGKDVVNEIYRMINNTTKGFIKYYKNKLLSVPYININDMHYGCKSQFHSFYYSIVNYDDEDTDYYTSKYEPDNEYNYIIDFDKEEFIITKYGYNYENRYVFDLFDIPDNWMDIVQDNDNYEYENKEEKTNNVIKNTILELEEEKKELEQKQLNIEEEINKLKLKLL